MTMHVPVENLLVFLRGTWQLRRRIHDLNLQVHGRFSGSSVFAETPDGLEYAESGHMHFAAYAGPASRVYRYVKTARSSQLEVRFSDDRFFHDLDLSRGEAEVSHQCGSDGYTGCFRVLHHNSLSVRWSVVGPRKRLLIATRYRRLR